MQEGGQDQHITQQAVQQARNTFVEVEEEFQDNQQINPIIEQRQRPRQLDTLLPIRRRSKVRRNKIDNYQLWTAWKQYQQTGEGIYLQYIHKFQKDHQENYYFNRQKIKKLTLQFQQNQNLYNIKIQNGNSSIDIIFPFQPHQVQKKYMDRVIQSVEGKLYDLLQSPTGTGKTLAMILPLLSYHYYLRMKGQHIKILFFSRTHSQLEQVYKQLWEKSSYSPTTSRIGSRKVYCKNKDVTQQAKEKDKDIRNCCSKAIKPFFQGNPQNSCKFFLDRISQVQQQNISSFHEFRDIEDLDDAICPVYQNLYRQQFTDLFLMPYDYLLNAALLPRYKPLIKNSVVVIDEAHNVLDKSCSGRQFTFSLSVVIDKIPLEITTIISKLQKDILQAQNTQRFLVQEINKKSITSQQKIRQIKDVQIRYNTDSQKQLIRKLQDYSEFILTFQRNFQKLMLDVDENRFKLYEALADRLKNLAQERLYRTQEEMFGSFHTHYIKAYTYPQILAVLHIMFLGTNEQTVKEFMTANIARENFDRRRAESLRRQLQRIEQFINSLFFSYERVKYHNKQIISILTFFNFIKRIYYLIIQDEYHYSRFNQAQNEGKIKFIEQNQLYHYSLAFKAKIKQIKPKDKLIHKKSEGFQFYGEKLQFKMLVPWFTFKEIASYGPRSILFTSGTMSPMQDWQKELRIPLRNNPFQNGPMIQPDQIRTHVLKMGHRLPLNFQYEQGNNLNQKLSDLTRTIYQIIKHVPHGVLVFFPSKKLLKNFRNVLNSQANRPIREFISGEKHQIFEDQNADFKTQIEQYQSRSYNGAILYCYLRGRISQGIDLPDHQCRAVIMVGVPYANPYEPYMAQKKKHYQRLSKAPLRVTPTWTTINDNNMIRAVNQAVGRVIRNSRDYGQIFLLDQRYGYVGKQLSQWIPRDNERYKIWKDRVQDNAFLQEFQRIELFYDQLKLRYPTKRDKDQARRN